jgi:hypothetical protein
MGALGIRELLNQSKRIILILIGLKQLSKKYNFDIPTEEEREEGSNK